jgi:glutathione S-transferase
MAEFTLVVGNKNYSSWSMRGGLMVRIAGIECDEIVIPLDLPETAAAIRKHSPSGRVPVLLHRGFMELRNNMPMNIRASFPGKGMTPGVRADIERVTSIWRDCRKRFAGAAPKDDGFLFGSFGAADAMYAPVVMRFRTFGVPLDADSEAYATAVLAHPAVKEWIDAAKNEPWLIDQYELK